MNNKVTIQEINSQLAQRSGLSKKKAETFIRCFFEQITSSLSNEQYVKIKNFGTFKTIIVEERESINIKTGERISIDKHPKVSFTPDNFLKELVNRPFSQFQSATLEDETTDAELQKIAEDVAAEVQKTNAAQAAAAIPAPFAEPQPADEVKADETTAKQNDEATEGAVPPPPPSPIADVPCPPEIPVPEVQAEDEGAKSVSNKTENTAESETAAAEENEVAAESGNSKKAPRIIAYIAGALLLLVIGYFCGKSGIFGGKNDAASPVKTESANTKGAGTETNPDAMPAQAGAEKAVAPAEQPAETLLEELPYSPVTKGPKGRPMKIVGDLGSYQLKKGDLWYRIASKVYGDADMVRYIIEYNNIENPNTIAPGTIVKLPKLEDAQ